MLECRDVLVDWVSGLVQISRGVLGGEREIAQRLRQAFGVGLAPGILEFWSAGGGGGRIGVVREPRDAIAQQLDGLAEGELGELDVVGSQLALPPSATHSRLYGPPSESDMPERRDRPWVLRA